MRSKLFLLLPLPLLLSLLLTPCLQAQECRVDTKHDRFTGTTTVSTPLDYLTTPVGVLFQSHTGSIKMVLARGGSTFRYIDCNSVVILADDKRVDLPFEYQASLIGGGRNVSEIWAADIGIDTLCELSRAEKVEYRVCSDEFTISRLVLCSGRLICDMSGGKKD